MKQNLFKNRSANIDLNSVNIDLNNVNVDVDYVDDLKKASENFDYICLGIRKEIEKYFSLGIILERMDQFCFGYLDENGNKSFLYAKIDSVVTYIPDQDNRIDITYDVTFGNENWKI